MEFLIEPAVSRRIAPQSTDTTSFSTTAEQISRFRA